MDASQKLKVVFVWMHHNKNDEMDIYLLYLLWCLFPHLGFPGFPTTHSHRHTKIADLIISNLIINLLKFVVLSSLRCLVPVRFSIIIDYSSYYF